MSFSRLPYDECSYVYDVNQSMGVGQYVLKTPKPDDNVFFSNPSVPLNRYGASVCESNVIDVDSELLGLNVKHTNCPSQQYRPSDKPFCNLVNMKELDPIRQVDTRQTNPPCTLRGTGWNRWEWLCQNPQDTALVPFETNINNRIVVKDNHRPCIPKPMDNTLALPKERAGHEPVQDWRTYEQTSFPVVHWRSCKEIKQL